MILLQRTLQAIAPASSAAAEEAQRLLDAKTKPLRSLGRLEDLACRVAAASHQALPARRSGAIVVAGGDHGVAAEGVSAYPQEVTPQMLLNFAHGGAAINALAGVAGARVVVVDAGVVTAPDHPAILDRRVGPGTASITQGPAMSREQAVQAIENGIGVAYDLLDDGVNLLATGDMGIGNTTPSSAIVACFTRLPPAAVTGRGTGVDDSGLSRKVAAIERALQVNTPDPDDALGVLAALGGFEIATLAGVVLAGAARHVPVIVDGLISSAAALVAARLAPDAAGYLIGSHRSVEIGHRAILDELGLTALFDLELRLGEGTGAALAMPLVDAALAVLHEMATFESAAVSGPADS